MKNILLIILLVPIFGFGSNSLEELKFELISVTIQFLATDEKISNTKDFPFDCKVLQYDCLNSYCENKQIVGGIDRVKKWKVIPVKNVSELKYLSDEIVGEITNVQDGKVYRTKFSNYEDYTRKLNEIVNSYVEKSSNQLPVGDDSMDEDGSSEINSEHSQSNGNGIFLNILAFIFGIVGAVLSVFLLTKQKLLNKLYFRLNSVETRLTTFIDELPNLKRNSQSEFDIEKYNNLMEKIANLESKILQKEKRQFEFEVENKKQQVNIEEIKESAQHKYAKIPDIPNGFSNSLLVQYQDGEQIYEIIIKDNIAEFRVANDEGAQKYALSDFNYYLSPACSFMNQPLKGSKIQTSKSGILRKEGNNWILEQKAQIEFV